MTGCKALKRTVRAPAARRHGSRFSSSFCAGVCSETGQGVVGRYRYASARAGADSTFAVLGRMPEWDLTPGSQIDYSKRVAQEHFIDDFP